MTALLLTSVLLPATTTIRVDGEGYLRLALAGRLVYAKSATLMSVDGRLGTKAGAMVMPAIAIEPEADSIDVDLEGNVSATTAGKRSLRGKLVLAVFEDSASLALKDGFYVAATRPKLVQPGEGLAGVIRGEGKAEPSKTPNRPEIKTALPAASPASTGRTFIRIHPESEVEGSRYTIGDVATVEGDEKIAAAVRMIELGATPPIGVDRNFDKTWITARLRAAGQKWDQITIEVPTGAKVLRKSNRIAPEKIVEAAIAGANEKFGEFGTLICRTQGTEWRLPLGEFNLAVETVTEANQKISVTVAAYVDGKRVGARQLQLERTGVPPALKVGQTVTIRVRSNGVAIQTRGRVSQTGRPGQPVEVTTADGTKLIGRVIDGSTVEVDA